MTNQVKARTTETLELTEAPGISGVEMPRGFRNTRYPFKSPRRPEVTARRHDSSSSAQRGFEQRARPRFRGFPVLAVVLRRQASPRWHFGH